MPRKVAKKPTKKRTGKRKGAGWLGDIGKAGLKILAPVLVDALGGLIKGKVQGMGMRKKKATRKRKGTSVRVRGISGRSVRP